MAKKSDGQLVGLIDEVRLMWNALVQKGETLHAEEPVTMAMRAVLEYLGRNGPTSVPNIARSRRVTRQHIQMQVNALLDEGLVTLEENPAHKRSLLATMTKRGEQTLERMKRREASVFDGAKIRTPEVELGRAARTLREVRQALEG